MRETVLQDRLRAPGLLAHSSTRKQGLGSDLSYPGDLKELEMASLPVVTTQPQYGVPVSSISRNTWQTGLMDCCTDCGVCLCGTFCFPCLGCQVAGDMSECCLCGTSVAMRTLYRTRYSIPGSICSDFCITLCCPVCSVCQIKRDINRRRALGIFW
ncbi:placenta-specific gene 8 protein isoform X6 [Struthio camelus]|uniref:placenta-specific gene 8 protein isoform X6 n=1 Tax=Struthio camelus TaxID=8801 RepID=UPI003604180A